jgi:toxin YoeB
MTGRELILKFWQIISLFTEIASTPFTGTGKPEPLRHHLKGKWSRRITEEHRLVYEVKDETIWIISCRFHYE